MDFLKPSGAILEGSTGMVGPDHSVEERCSVMAVRGWDLVSLNIGTVNFGDEVFWNPLPMVRTIAEAISRYGARADLEVFELGMLETVEKLAAEGILDRSLVINVTLGIQGTTMAATLRNLSLFRDALPRESIWGFVHNDAPDLALLIGALSLEVHFVRVGFENAHRLDSATFPTRNAEFAIRAAEIMRKADRSPMSPPRARALFRLG